MRMECGDGSLSTVARKGFLVNRMQLEMKSKGRQAGNGLSNPSW